MSQTRCLGDIIALLNLLVDFRHASCAYGRPFLLQVRFEFGVPHVERVLVVWVVLGWELVVSYGVVDDALVRLALSAEGGGGRGRVASGAAVDVPVLWEFGGGYVVEDISALWWVLVEGAGRSPLDVPDQDGYLRCSWDI